MAALLSRLLALVPKHHSEAGSEVIWGMAKGSPAALAEAFDKAAVRC